jgi:hypothetical protein
LIKCCEKIFLFTLFDLLIGVLLCCWGPSKHYFRPKYPPWIFILLWLFLKLWISVSRTAVGPHCTDLFHLKMSLESHLLLPVLENSDYQFPVLQKPAIKCLCPLRVSWFLQNQKPTY